MRPAAPRPPPGSPATRPALPPLDGGPLSVPTTLPGLTVRGTGSEVLQGATRYRKHGRAVGKGHIGSVYLCIHKVTGETFALKEQPFESEATEDRGVDFKE